MHCDGRLGPLSLALKAWGLRTGVLNPTNGGMSSYALVCLFLHFAMSGLRQPLLPCLTRTHPHLFSPDLPLPDLVRLKEDQEFKRAIQWTSENRWNCSQILLAFFAYYASFDWSRYALRLAEGAVVPQRQLARFRGSGPFTIVAQEPYTRRNVAQSIRNRRDPKSGPRFIQAQFRATIDEWPTNRFLETFH